MRGAYSLMASTVVTSLLGVAFWIVAARLYPASDVGRDSALIAAMMALSGICQLNAANAIPRFLPQVRDPARALRLAYLASAGAALALAVLVRADRPAARGRAWRPWAEEPALAAGFVLATVLWGAFSIQDAALTALRRASWVPVENAAYGLLKLAALPLLVAAGAGYGIFQSWVLPTILLIVPVTVLPVPIGHPRPPAPSTPAPGPPSAAPASVRFLAQDYGASTVAFVATAALPLLVLALLGSQDAAYFAIAYVLVRTLDLLATNAGTSVTVESAFDEERLHAARPPGRPAPPAVHARDLGGGRRRGAARAPALRRRLRAGGGDPAAAPRRRGRLPLRHRPVPGRLPRPPARRSAPRPRRVPRACSCWGSPWRSRRRSA